MATPSREKHTQREVASAALIKLADILGPKRATEPPPGFMTVSEVAELWNLSDTHVARKFSDANVERVKVGNRTYYRVEP